MIKRENRPETKSNEVSCTREKHHDLYAAIEDMHSVIEHLYTLIYKITGEDNKRQDLEQKPWAESDVSLITVLNEGAGTLKNVKSSAHDRIDEIDALLFLK